MAEVLTTGCWMPSNEVDFRRRAACQNHSPHEIEMGDDLSDRGAAHPFKHLSLST